MIYFIDTNIFLRVLIKDKNNTRVQNECVQVLQKAQKKIFACATSSVVFAEIVWTLKSFYGFSKPEVIKALTLINNLHLVIKDNYQTSVAIKKYKDNNIKYIDALIASIPEIQNSEMTVISYDKDFDKLGVKRMEPNHLT